jgi:uncharacterized protein involved in copper resistance
VLPVELPADDQERIELPVAAERPTTSTSPASTPASTSGGQHEHEPSLDHEHEEDLDGGEHEEGLDGGEHEEDLD